MRSTMMVLLLARQAVCLGVGSLLLAACTITEPILQGMAHEPAPPPRATPLYANQEAIKILNFIGNTPRVALTNSKQTRIIDYFTQREIQTLLQAPDNVLDFAETDRTGRFFVHAGYNNADVWDLESGKLLHAITAVERDESNPKTRTILDSFKPVNSSSRYTRLSPDGKTLFFDNRLWDVAKEEQTLEFMFDHNIAQQGAEFSADGRYFALSGVMVGIQWVDLQTKQVVRLWKEGSNALRFGRDNRLYHSYSGSFYNIHVVMAEGGRFPSVIAVSQWGDDKSVAKYEPRSRIACWALLPNQQVFAALADRALVWLDENLTVLKHWRSEIEVTACVPDARQRLWLGTREHGLLRLNLEQGQLQQVLPFTHFIDSVTLSPDENYLGLVFPPPSISRVEIYKTAELP